jgi:hypothetical protein
LTTGVLLKGFLKKTLFRSFDCGITAVTNEIDYQINTFLDNPEILLPVINGLLQFLNRTVQPVMIRGQVKIA